LLLAQMKELRGMRRSVCVPVRRVVAPSVIRTRTGTGNRNLHPHLHVLLQLLIGKSRGVKG
jgi:hypothetical protein